MAGDKVQVYQQIQGYQHREQCFEGIQLNTKRQGQDGAAEARHGLSGIGNQYNQCQPDQIVVHFNSNRDRSFTNA